MSCQSILRVRSPIYASLPSPNQTHTLTLPAPLLLQLVPSSPISSSSCAHNFNNLCSVHRIFVAPTLATCRLLCILRRCHLTARPRHLHILANSPTRIPRPHSISCASRQNHRPFERQTLATTPWPFRPSRGSAYISSSPQSLIATTAPPCDCPPMATAMTQPIQRLPSPRPRLYRLPSLTIRFHSATSLTERHRDKLLLQQPFSSSPHPVRRNAGTARLGRQQQAPLRQQQPFPRHLQIRNRHPSQASALHLAPEARHEWRELSKVAQTTRSRRSARTWTARASLLAPLLML